jgi:hypothetical protein
MSVSAMGDRILRDSLRYAGGVDGAERSFFDEIIALGTLNLDSL